MVKKPNTLPESVRSAHSAGPNRRRRTSVISASQAKATALMANSTSETPRRPSKKNELEMMPVAITRAKLPGLSAAISRPSQPRGLRCFTFATARQQKGLATMQVDEASLKDAPSGP